MRFGCRDGQGRGLTEIADNTERVSELVRLHDSFVEQLFLALMDQCIRTEPWKWLLRTKHCGFG